ncbi:MAG: heavy-metal-associated domain-containing protein [Candidatus Micrarchaeota archaeon]
MSEEQNPDEAVPEEKKEYKLTLSGMTCGACEKVIERVVSNNGAEVKEIDAGRGLVDIRCQPERIETIKQQLAQRGFRERGEGEPEERGDPRRFLAYLKSVIAGEPHARVENRLLNNALGTTIILVLAGALMYGAFLDIFGSPVAAASLLVFVISSSVMSVYSLLHMETYRKGMTCSNGMMVGMTTGMASGYMIGAILGATNGMFVGSVIGTAMGITIGLTLGRYSGIMGAMEGLMAGLMAGTMGAMTSLMMLNDNLLAFLYILNGLCLVMVGSLSYMMFREAGPASATAPAGNFGRFAGLSIAMSAVLVAIMLYGPRSLITIA